MPFGERAQCRGAQRVQHAASGNQQRPLGIAQHRHRLRELRLRGRQAPRNAMTGGAKPLFRIIVRHRLHVLRQRERHRPAQRWIGEHVDRLRQRGQQLRRMHDAIEEARHRPEAVVGRDRAVLEVLDLLQHGIGRARHEHVARQEQDRQPVHVRERGGRDEIGRAGADRCRARHHPPAKVRFRIGDGRVRHRLFVVRAVRRQFGAVPVQRLAHAGHVAVAEDREDAGEQRRHAVRRLRPQRRQVADQRLRHRQTHRVMPSPSRLRLSGQCGALRFAPRGRRCDLGQRICERSCRPLLRRAATCVAPQLDQHFEIVPHAALQLRIVDLVGEPGLARLLENRAADSEATARAACLRVAKSGRPALRCSHSGPALRRRGNAGRARRSARRRRATAPATSARASTTRDRCRGCTGASTRAAPCPRRAADACRGMISSNSSWPLAWTASYKRANLRLLLEPMLDRHRPGEN